MSFEVIFVTPCYIRLFKICKIYLPFQNWWKQNWNININRYKIFSSKPNIQRHGQDLSSKSLRKKYFWPMIEFSVYIAVWNTVSAFISVISMMKFLQFQVHDTMCLPFTAYYSCSCLICMIKRGVKIEIVFWLIFRIVAPSIHFRSSRSVWFSDRHLDHNYRARHDIWKSESAENHNSITKNYFLKIFNVFNPSFISRYQIKP